MEDTIVIESFLKNRSDETFFALYKVFFVRIRRYLLLRGLDASTAEDLTQEVMMKVYQKSLELRDAASFSAWVFSIARNLHISHWRREMSRRDGVELMPLSSELEKEPSSGPEVLERLRLAEWMEPLSDEQRELLALRFVEGLSYEELSEVLRIPVGTVKWRLSELRRKLVSIIGVETEARG